MALILSVYLLNIWFQYQKLKKIFLISVVDRETKSPVNFKNLKSSFKLALEDDNIFNWQQAILLCYRDINLKELIWSK